MDAHGPPAALCARRPSRPRPECPPAPSCAKPPRPCPAEAPSPSTARGTPTSPEPGIRRSWAPWRRRGAGDWGHIPFSGRWSLLWRRSRHLGASSPSERPRGRARLPKSLGTADPATLAGPPALRRPRGRLVTVRNHEIELWAHQAIDRATQGQPVEDSRVELKREWIDPAKAARRIAGHANAARGDSILWVIGVDEAAGTVHGVSMGFDRWWPSVAACFDEAVPAVHDIDMHRGDATIIAIEILTDRAPYVVKVHGNGGVDREVPWREGTHTRSARRSDLLRVLVPATARPSASVISGTVTFHPAASEWTYELVSR